MTRHPPYLGVLLVLVTITLTTTTTAFLLPPPHHHYHHVGRRAQPVVVAMAVHRAWSHDEQAVAQVLAENNNVRAGMNR